MDRGVTEAFFFLALLDGRTNALLSSTPFNRAPSDRQRHRVRRLNIKLIYMSILNKEVLISLSTVLQV